MEKDIQEMGVAILAINKSSRKAILSPGVGFDLVPDSQPTPSRSNPKKARGGSLDLSDPLRSIGKDGNQGEMQPGYFNRLEEATPHLRDGILDTPVGAGPSETRTKLKTRRELYGEKQTPAT